MNCSFQEMDKGTPLIVFLHGNSLDHSIFLCLSKESTLRPFRKALVNLPGHGSSKRLGLYSLETIKKALHELIANFQGSKFWLVGHSLGGHLCLQLSEELGNCCGLILVGTPPLRSMADCPRAFQLQNSGLLFSENWNFQDLIRLSNLFQPMEKDSLISILKRSDPMFRNMFAHPERFNTWKDEIGILQKSQIPIYLLYGKKDIFLSTDYLKKILPQIKNEMICVKVLEESGHLPFIDHPTRTAEILRNIIEKHSLPKSAE